MKANVWRILSMLLLATALLGWSATPSGSTPAAAQNASSVPAGSLLLWNKLGSAYEVQHSEVGPPGTIIGTAIAYEPGKFGNGFVRKAIYANYVTFPASLVSALTRHGSVEMWIVPKVPNPVPYAYGVFGLVAAPYGWGWGALPQHYDTNIALYWGDGVTGRGMSGLVFFNNVTVGTPWEAGQYVATPFVPFHAAISWDVDGIGGSGDTVRVYRDGVMVVSASGAWNPDSPTLYDLVLGFSPDSGGYDKYITDNIKVWNYAKTDFSDRFVEYTDMTPPQCTVGATPSTLWPPNNKLVTVNTTVNVTDAGGSGPNGFTLVSVATNEGNTASEISGWDVGTPDTRGQLMAARNGNGNERVYTLTYRAADNAGNTALCATEVRVPHDQGR